MTLEISIRRAALQGCVRRMKAKLLTGKTRDDAAANYLCGAMDAAKAAGVDIAADVEAIQNGGYTAVLETLALLPDDDTDPAPVVNDLETPED